MTEHQLIVVKHCDELRGLQYIFYWFGLEQKKLKLNFKR